MLYFLYTISLKRASIGASAGDATTSHLKSTNSSREINTLKFSLLSSKKSDEKSTKSLSAKAAAAAASGGDSLLSGLNAVLGPVTKFNTVFGSFEKIIQSIAPFAVPVIVICEVFRKFIEVDISQRTLMSELFC